MLKHKKWIFLFPDQNICGGCSKEPSQRDSSFEHPKHMYELIDKKFSQFYAKKVYLIGRMIISAVKI